MLKSELYWAAGFIDGEGCFYVKQYTHRDRLLMAFQVTQAHTAPLLRLKEVFPFLGLYGPRQPKGLQRKQYWYLRSQSEKNVLYMARVLRPALSAPKIEQISRCLERVGREW